MRTTTWVAGSVLALAVGAIANCSLVNSADDPLPPGPSGGAAPGGAAPGGGGFGADGAGGFGGQGGSGGSGGLPTSCTDGVQNEGETGVDCGGGICLGCENGIACFEATDCLSSFCDDTQEPTPLCAPCVDDDSCLDAPDTYCDEQSCVTKKAAGELCEAENECLSGFCVDGLCCDVACEGACEACNLEGFEGTCTPVADGEPGDPVCAPFLCDGVLGTCSDSCSGPEDCTTDAFCSGGSCLGQKEPGDPCVNGPECLSGNCVDDVCCTVAACGTTDDCNICQPTDGTCGTAPLDHACSDGLYCNGPDACDAGGACVPTGVDPCAALVDDGDANCAEACNEASDDCTADEPDTTPCNDTIYCNGADSCVLGACTAHLGDPCAGNVGDADDDCSESCSETADACTANDPNGSVCSDGLYCTGTDSCQSGACSTHSGNPCPGPDADNNCAESCNEASGNCTANDPNGAACSDGSYCNGADTCSNGVCSTHAGNPCPGPDDDDNCSESCDDVADTCTANDPNGAPCNDGTYCNGLDTCSNGACSVHGTNPCPGPDGDDDCSESCSESAGACTANDPNNSPCNDGTFCNGTDACSNGTCATHSGDPCLVNVGDPDNDCSESCSESAGACTANDPNGSACNDGTFCNGTDTCSGGSCSNHTGDPCLAFVGDPDNDCSESCSESAGACTANDPNGSACNDGTYCNGTDTCSNGSCSNHNGNPCPGPDGDSDCSETCYEVGDNCTTNDPNGSLCPGGVCGSGSCIPACIYAANTLCASCSGSRIASPNWTFTTQAQCDAWCTSVGGVSCDTLGLTGWNKNCTIMAALACSSHGAANDYVFQALDSDTSHCLSAAWTAPNCIGRYNTCTPPPGGCACCYQP